MDALRQVWSVGEQLHRTPVCIGGKRYYNRNRLLNQKKILPLQSIAIKMNYDKK